MALGKVHTGRSGQNDHWQTLTELFQVAGWKLHRCMIDCQEVPPSSARVQPYKCYSQPISSSLIPMQAIERRPPSSI